MKIHGTSSTRAFHFITNVLIAVFCSNFFISDEDLMKDWFRDTAGSIVNDGIYSKGNGAKRESQYPQL